LVVAARTAALALIALLLSAPAVSAQFGPVEVSNPDWRVNDRFFTFAPQVVADSSGRAFWASFHRAEFSDQEQAVVYERCGTPAAWKPTLLGSPADELFPLGIFGNAAGAALVAWRVEGSGGTNTFFTSYKAPGGSWGAPQQVVSGAVTHVTFAVGGNGDAVAGWNQTAPTAALKASIRPANGSWGSPSPLKDAAQDAHVAMSETGDAVLTTFDATAPAEVEAFYRPAGGSFGAKETVDFPPFAVQPNGHFVEFTGGGQAVAVFSQQGKLWAVARASGIWQDTATLLDDTAFTQVKGLARHPSGLVAVWWRGAGTVPNDIGVARLGSGGWETSKLYDLPNALGNPTAAADVNGKILLAAYRTQGTSDEQEEIWGTTVASLSTPWPAGLTRLSPASNGTLRYRDPIASGAGDQLVLGWGVHGSSDRRSEAIATAGSPACPAGGGNPNPNPSPVLPGSGGGNQVGSLVFGASTQVTLNLGIKSIPAGGPLAVVVSNANGFAISGDVAGQTAQAVVARRRKARRIALKTKAFKVAARSKTTVKLTLPKALRKLLKRKGKLKLSLRARVRDPAGNTRSVTKTVSPRLKKKSKRKR
jgi:hypothetical protein